jgi:type I restriction enzyme M protein
MHATLIQLEKKLWSAADELRANSELKSSEYSVPVLGLIFLRYADVKFANAPPNPRLAPAEADFGGGGGE